MVEETVGRLAESVNTPVARLLDQIREAGLPQRSADDAIGGEEKERLLAYVKKIHGKDEGDKPKKMTLKSRKTSTLKMGGGRRGGGGVVNVEVRKKRTFVRPEAMPEADSAPGEIDSGEANKIAESPASRLADDAEQKRQEAVRQRAEQAAMRTREIEGRKREEEARKEAEAKQAEENKKNKAKSKEKDADKEKDKAADAVAPAPIEENKVSTRKDRRDRHDLDTEDLQQKKSKHGDRKRRVEQLIGEDLLDLDAIDEPLDEPVTESSAADEKGAETLGLSSPRTPRAAKPAKRHKFNAPTEKVKREVELGDSVTVAQLAHKMSVKATDVIKTLSGLDVMAAANESIDQETATLVVEEFGHDVKLIDADEIEKSLEEELVYEEAEVRAPVVTVMGHVDHGKTSLLDQIRSTQVATGEAGGITQHIGAYRVTTDHGDICFIDTPGHAAFTAMRARGANATDIVILVVAADDGVMPQTEEAIAHAKGAGAPIVVAINKIDKEGADPERARNELAAREVIPDDWGGDTQFVPVSALTGEGLSDLLDAVLLQAELLELKAAKVGPAQGVVIESELDKGRGPVATLLVQNGTLKRGDIVVAGSHFGKIRALVDENGKTVASAGPATPVAVLGLNGTANAGDPFTVTKDEKRAREVAEHRLSRANEARLGSQLDKVFDNFGENETKTLNIVVKADVRGSLEAIVSALTDLGNDEVKVNVVMQGVGGIGESDATYAVTSGAVIFGFNVRADNTAKKVIDAEGLDLRYYNVIYDLVDDVKAALNGMLSPEVREEIVGIAEVKQVFTSKKMGDIAGCMVVDGTVFKSKRIRVLRDSVVIYEGELESLRHFKDEVENVSSGTECGIGVRNYNDVRVGDQIEVFDTQEVARQL